jgi:hypothetical protein
MWRRTPRGPLPSSLSLSLSLSLAALCAAWSSACGGGTTVEGSGGGAGGHTVILDGGGEIPSPPNGASLCPAGACNYQTSASCPPDMPSCVPALTPQGTAAPVCQPAGAGLSGASCSVGTHCAAGYLCAAGACRKLCCGGDWTGCPSASEHCVQTLALQNTSGDPISTGAMLCYPVNTCDALAPSSCDAPGTTCQIVDPTGATACFPEGTGASGEPCPCKGGFLCVKGECRRLCKAVEGGGEPYCEEGEGICVHFNRDPPGVGECTLSN